MTKMIFLLLIMIRLLRSGAYAINCMMLATYTYMMIITNLTNDIIYAMT